MSHSLLLTNSRLKTARSCARRHRIEYVLGYRPVVDSEELAFGSLVHLALAAWWSTTVGGEKLTAALAVLAAVEGVDQFVLARAQVMLAGYDARWRNEPIEAVVVERRFEMPLVNPNTGAESRIWRLGGKVDVLARNTATGRLVLIEHKTSGEDLSPGGFYWRRLRLDSQVSIYFDGGAALGYGPVDECIYDVLAKPEQRPLKATPIEKRKFTGKGTLYANQRAEDETLIEYQTRVAEEVEAAPERYFMRAEVVRLDSELYESRVDVWQQAQRLREDERLNRAPRNPEACAAYGRVCPYFDVCTGAAELIDERLFRHSENVHPELTEEPAPAASGTAKEMQPHDSANPVKTSNATTSSVTHEADERREGEATTPLENHDSRSRGCREDDLGSGDAAAHFFGG